jgi:hypothetical protein
MHPCRIDAAAPSREHDAMVLQAQRLVGGPALLVNLSVLFLDDLEPELPGT